MAKMKINAGKVGINTSHYTILARPDDKPMSTIELYRLLEYIISQTPRSMDSDTVTGAFNEALDAFKA